LCHGVKGHHEITLRVPWLVLTLLCRWLHNDRDGIINALPVAETGTQNLFMPLQDKWLQQCGHIKEMDKIQKSALAKMPRKETYGMTQNRMVKCFSQVLENIMMTVKKEQAM
jgi:hypothetical protein